MKELVLELTNSCNRNCRHCSTRANDEPEIVLDTDTIESALNEFKPKYVDLSGGEPLLINNLSDIISIVRKHGCKIRLYTTLFYEKYDEVDEICISCFGKNRTNKYITKTEYRPFDLMRQYLSVGVTPTVHIVPMSVNIKEISLAIENCIRIGITKIKILKLVEQGRCPSNKIPLVPDDFELKALYNQFKDNPYVSFGSPFTHKCGAGTQKMVVMPNGNIIPCESFKDGICKCKHLKV